MDPTLGVSLVAHSDWVGRLSQLVSLRPTSVSISETITSFLLDCIFINVSYMPLESSRMG